VKFPAFGLSLLITLTVISAPKVFGASDPSLTNTPAPDSPQATLATIKNLLKKDPKNPDLLKQASELAIRTEDYPDAAIFVQARLAQNPNDFPLRSILPTLYSMAHDQANFEHERDILGRVDIHLIAKTAAARLMIAMKLSSVLS
jgi:hypothetical protein